MKINKLFNLILKIKKYFLLFLLFSKILGIDNIFYFDFMCFSLNEGEKNDNDHGMLIAAIKFTTPLRYCIYGLIVFYMVDSYDNIGPELALTIFASIEIIDKSIITFIEEKNE